MYLIGWKKPTSLQFRINYSLFRNMAIGLIVAGQEVASPNQGGIMIEVAALETSEWSETFVAMEAALEFAGEASPPPTSRIDSVVPAESAT